MSVLRPENDILRLAQAHYRIDRLSASATMEAPGFPKPKRCKVGGTSVELHSWSTCLKWLAAHDQQGEELDEPQPVDPAIAEPPRGPLALKSTTSARSKKLSGNPFAKETLNRTGQARSIASDPAKARRMMEAAGYSEAAITRMLGGANV